MTVNEQIIANLNASLKNLERASRALRWATWFTTITIVVVLAHIVVLLGRLV